jgi:hypothetical protein
MKLNLFQMKKLAVIALITLLGCRADNLKKEDVNSADSIVLKDKSLSYRVFYYIDGNPIGWGRRPRIFRVPVELIGDKERRFSVIGEYDGLDLGGSGFVKVSVYRAVGDNRIEIDSFDSGFTKKDKVTHSFSIGPLGRINFLDGFGDIGEFDKSDEKDITKMIQIFLKNHEGKSETKCKSVKISDRSDSKTSCFFPELIWKRINDEGYTVEKCQRSDYKFIVGKKTVMVVRSKSALEKDKLFLFRFSGRNGALVFDIDYMLFARKRKEWVLLR